ncbi:MULTISPECIES: hypothetical protein [Thalassotalea]|uniref:hypothetical protein n=1 Tax=Thalassotalea TaxID=1518149 RepID=UPI000944BC04|nr:MULTISPECIES: hypothetical protein [Thalassotalea]OKY27354.1 hypothetical protein BI291_00565 [Thalassotalea sp. PP2-459]
MNNATKYSIKYFNSIIEYYYPHEEFINMVRKLVFISLLSIMVGAHADEKTFVKPMQFSFGSTLEDVRRDIDKECLSIEVQNITPITAPLAKTSQTQINCSGFMYGGQARNVELVFQDDQLDIVWILFPKEEKQAFISSFKTLYGEPTMEIDYGAIFLQANAAIRNEPSEVLFASNRQVKVMMSILKQQLAKPEK